MKKILFLFFILFASELASVCQKIELITARDVAVATYLKHNLVQDVQISSVIPIGLNNDTLLYIVTFNEKGFVIVSGYRSAPPVLGQCFTDVYDTKKMPPGLLYLLEKYKYGISKLIENKIIPTKETEKKWDNILSSDFTSNKGYTVGEYILATTWDQYDMYESEANPIFCTGVAMAQILFNYSCRVTGPSPYFWYRMHLDSEDADNAFLILDCCIACRRPNHPGSSTPGRARDAFVDDFGISSYAEVKWRISHLFGWQGMLEDEIDLERPILYSAGNISFDGHSWVIDGYNSQDQFHCNWGWGGAYNDFYSLGDFDPGGQGPFNDIESAIFNVVPIQTSGVVTPQLTAQSYTYNSNGYPLSVPETFGATSYEWTTQYGTISGSGSSVTLYSDFTTNVQVRAYNNRCQIYSSYDSETMTINYGPISGSTLLCSAGSQYTISNVPSSSTITWTQGSYVNRTSAQGSNPCTFSATGVGNSWVRAQITTTHGSVYLPDYSIWAGTPILNISGPGYGYVDNTYIYGALPSSTLSSPNYYWCDIDPSSGNYLYYNQNYAYVSFYEADRYELMFKAQNSCGIGGWNYKYIYIEDEEDFLMFPNPASETISISVSKQATSTEIGSSTMIENDGITTYTINILDLNGILHYTTIKSGSSFNIPIGTLRDGNYIVQIDDGKKATNLSLIVKH